MKVTIYFDVYPWTNESSPNTIWPTCDPTIPKDVDVTRYKIQVEIPDPKKPDVVIDAVAEEVVK